MKPTQVKSQLAAAAMAVAALTLILGLAYPLALTGIAQVAFPGASDGSLVERDGRVVGSSLIGQSFAGEPGYFQSRPSQSGYAADATFFSNQGPNAKDQVEALDAAMAAYLERERRFDPGLRRDEVPPDAVMTSASGVDPHISPANASIQARRVAAVRGLPLARVMALVEESTDGRGLGLFGEPGVNVLRLNISLDEEAGR